MTDRALLQQALEALEDAHAHMEHYQDEKARERAITALRERLAQPEQEHIIDCPRCGHCCPQPEQKPVAAQEPRGLIDIGRIFRGEDK